MDKEGKQQFIIKICCVIAAFGLWLFISSTENPVTTYKIKNIPVELLNTDVLTRSNLILSPGQDLTISLTIKGDNTNILLAKKAEDFKVVADLSTYALKSGEQKIPIEIRKSPDNVNVVNSDNLFIKINLDQLIEAKLPINVNVSGKLKEGFYASAPMLSQKNATVVGGSKFVNIVKEILIEADIQGLESDVTKTYKLKPVDAAGKEVKEVVVNPSHMDVKIPIRKTKSVGVIVKTIGSLDPSFRLGSIKVLSNRLDITGSVAALNQIENLNTEAIDLSKINKSTTLDARVIIPAGLSLVNGSDSGMVKIQINLEKVVQKNISIDIKYINLGEKYEAKFEKDKVLLVVSGTEAVINALDLAKFSATVDLVNLVEGEHTVKVLVSMPEGITLISEEPDEKLITITKKQTEGTTSDGN
jgi:YbbR domain-containing protein